MTELFGENCARWIARIRYKQPEREGRTNASNTSTTNIYDSIKINNAVHKAIIYAQ
jgi:hypothetical protein